MHKHTRARTREKRVLRSSEVRERGSSLPLTPAQEQLVGVSALTTLRLVAEALLETLDAARRSLTSP